MNSEEELVPVTFEVTKAVGPKPQHPVVADTYKEVAIKKENLVNNRKDACLLA